MLIGLILPKLVSWWTGEDLFAIRDQTSQDCALLIISSRSLHADMFNIAMLHVDKSVAPSVDKLYPILYMMYEVEGPLLGGPEHFYEQRDRECIDPCMANPGFRYKVYRPPVPQASLGAEYLAALNGTGSAGPSKARNMI